MGNRRRAQATLEEARALAEDHDLRFVLSYVLSNQGDLLRDRGEIEAALAAYHRSLDLKEQMGNPFAIAYTWNSLATLYRQTGDLGQARAYSQRALALRRDQAGVVEHLLYREEHARIELADGDLGTAAREFDSIAAELERLEARHHWVRVSLVAGYAHWLLSGKIPDGLHDILQVAEQQHYDALIDRCLIETPAYALVVWAGVDGPAILTEQLIERTDIVLPELSRMLAPAKESAMSPEMAEALIKLLPRLPGNQPIELLTATARQQRQQVSSPARAVLDHLLESPPPSLAITGFDGLRVRRRGRLIPEQAWTRRRALDLLALLALAGPRGRNRDEIIADCWPEAAPESGVAQFHTHLRALRAALEPESLHGDASRYVINDGQQYRLVFDHVEFWDVSAFNVAFERALSHERAEEPEPAADAYHEVVELYRGPLFAGLRADGDWLIECQEHYLRRALQAAQGLAEFRRESGDLASAVDAWERVLELDQCREKAHRELMRLYLALGRRDDALAQYRQCDAALRRELGVEPHPDTTALYRRILAHQPS